MEAKYKKFLEFKWENSSEWQMYYTNLFPTPPSHKILHYKKKFYKLKVDSDFDINYSPASENNANSSSSSSTNTNANSNTRSNYSTGNTSNSSQNQYNNQSNRNSYSNNQGSNQYSQPNYNNYSNPQANNNTNSTALVVENLFWVICLLGIIFQFGTHKFALIALLTRLIRVNGFPKWNVNYLQQICMDVHFQLAFYTLIFMIEKYLFFTLIPLVITGLINISEYAVTLAQAPAMVREFANQIYSKKNYLSGLRSDIEIGIGFLLILGIFLGINSFFTALFIWQYLKFKHTINENTKNSFIKLGGLIDNALMNPQVPGLVKTVLSKIKQAGIYLGSTDQNQGISQSCVIF